jgi:hypothetical protein
MTKRKPFRDSEPMANRMRISELQKGPDKQKRLLMRNKRRFKRTKEITFFRHLLQLYMRWPKSDIMTYDEIGLTESALGLAAPPVGEPLSSYEGRIMRCVARLTDLGQIEKGSWDHAEMFKFSKRMRTISPC